MSRHAQTGAVRSDQTRLCAVLDQLRSPACQLSEILLGDATRHGEIGTRMLPQARMMMVLRGAHTVQVSIKHTRHTVVLRPGQGLFLEPQAWFCPDYRTDYSLFGLVFFPDKLRLLINDHEASRGHRPPRCWQHVPTTARSALALTVQALSALVRDGGDERAAAPLVQAVLALGQQALTQAGRDMHHGSPQIFQAIVDYLHVHCQDDLDRNLVAQAFGLHPGHVSRLFQQQGPASFTETLNRLRLDRATDLLQTTDLPVAIIATECGYGSAVHFIRRFRRRFGSTPGQYRVSTRR